MPWCVRADSLTRRTRVVKRTVVVCLDWSALVSVARPAGQLPAARAHEAWRARAQRDRFHGRWQYLFIESICNDEAVLEQNYRYKMMYSPDYTEQDSEAVRARPIAPPCIQSAPHGTSAVGEQCVSRMLTRWRAGLSAAPLHGCGPQAFILGSCQAASEGRQGPACLLQHALVQQRHGLVLSTRTRSAALCTCGIVLRGSLLIPRPCGHVCCGHVYTAVQLRMLSRACAARKAGYFRHNDLT